jgi:pyruvate dehydrogenase E2 component (dihydrolipoamide acetyltransferase)
MATEVVMPRLGWTMEEGSIVEWRKRDGEAVQAGEILFVIESDKAAIEVEALGSGILRIPADAPPPGAVVPIGTRLAYLVAPGEPTPGSVADAPAVPAPDATGDTVSGRTLQPPASRSTLAQPATGTPAISPRARRVASELGVDWTRLASSSRSGRIVERDVRAAAERLAAQAALPAARSTPLARKVAAEAGLDVAALASARPGERLTRADVEAATAPPPAVAGTPLSGIRRLTAMRLSESARATVPVTLTTEADASRLVRLRAEIAQDLAGADTPVPTYTDLLARLTAVALTEHPALNASLVDDRIVVHTAVHLGLAVDTARGLLVPVIRDAARLSVQQLAAEATRLIAAARAGTLAPDDLRGGTFTLTNLGMYEIDAFTPVINLPECAILGIGRIVARPVVVDEAAETIAVRKMLALSLTFDHRVVDGAPAARFLQRVKHLIERPTLGLIQ